MTAIVQLVAVVLFKTNRQTAVSVHNRQQQHELVPSADYKYVLEQTITAQISH